jgi:hypothetical protein
MLTVKKALAFVLSATIAYSPLVAAETKKESVAQLLDAMKIEDQMVGGFEAMLPVIHQLAAKLQLDQAETEELKEIYRDWFNNDFDKFYISTQIADLYADTFTHDEIKAITEFYLTPAGQKLVEKSPELAKLGARFGMEEAQRKQQQLLEKLGPFIEKHSPEQ